MMTALMDSRIQGNLHLPTYERAIRAENLKALARRWHIARSPELVDPRVIARWFPGQRNLLELLAVLSEDEVIRLADCAYPLFSMMIHTGLLPTTSASLVQPGEFEAANRQEAFMALSVRVDSIKTSFDEACVLFDLSMSEAVHVRRFGPHELWDISANPGLVMFPVASDPYFEAVATRDLTASQKTQLMVMSRRSKNRIH
jgi:hypothetical protein